VKATEKMRQLLKDLMDGEVIEKLEDVEIVNTKVVRESDVDVSILRVEFTARLTVQLPPEETQQFTKIVSDSMPVKIGCATEGHEDRPVRGYYRKNVDGLDVYLCSECFLRVLAQEWSVSSTGKVGVEHE